MVVTEGDDIRAVVFDDGGFVFVVAEDGAGGPAGVFEVLEASFFVVIWEEAFDCFDGFVTGDYCDDFVSKFFGLMKEVFVTGVKVVEGAEDHDEFFLG